VFVSASVGITMIPQDGMDPAVLLKNADLAMYRAKDQGRNNYQFFRKKMNDEAAERLTLENDLRRAMYRDELELHYQPVTAEAGAGVVALEALLRWHHPQRGMVGPEVFISVAEESGLLVPMGQWVLRKACSEVKALQDAGYDDLGVCVNLSARQFRDPNLVGSVQATLTGTGLEARYLHLEITEPMLMDNLEDAIATVWQLKELGAAVSIDDFGAGYSSLRYLKRLPVDRLKVDRTFVSDIPWDEDAKAITAAVIAMAHKLQLSVVAEGVETQAQLEFLKENHCDFFQGHLFSAPLPVEEVRSYLRVSS
jgi:EAL domain-containing protein (putative c-di-GMP-specific phosphodiesterase class I)